MCGILDISRASYYKWLHRDIPLQEMQNIELAELIKEYDERFGHILGYRRMTSWINHFNQTEYSMKRVHRIMKKLDIHAVIRKKKKKYTPTTADAIAENLLQRDFYADGPNEKWTTDVTEFKVPGGEKKLYLSAILDLYDRFPVSYVISCRNDNPLVFKTFDKAIEENPDARPIFHSDRGFQYTSRVFHKKLLDQEMQQSMSRSGHCIDNGPTEGFWGIIKTEMYQMYEITDEASLRHECAPPAADRSLPRYPGINVSVDDPAAVQSSFYPRRSSSALRFSCHCYGCPCMFYPICRLW